MTRPPTTRHCSVAGVAGARGLHVVLWMTLAAACAAERPPDPASCTPAVDMPRHVANARRSPDGRGYCCAPEGGTCDCGYNGGFVEDPCDCGRIGRIRGWCDVAPQDWLSATDEHGCVYLYARFPQTACCNCPPDASRSDGG